MARQLWLRTLALLFLSPLPLAGQEPLTLDAAVKAALDQNASLRAARAASAEAAARVTEARSGWFPRVSFAESWQRSDQPVFVFSSLLAARRFGAGNFALDALNNPDPHGFFRTSVGVEQMLFDGGRQRSLTTAATLHRDIARLAADQAAAGVALETTQAFGRVLTAQAAARSAAAGLEAARQDLSRAEQRRDVGMATEADVLALAVHAADLQQRAIQAEGDAAVGVAELNRLTGAPIDRAAPLVEPSTQGGAVLESSNLAELLAEAGRARPELRRAAAAEQVAHAARRQATAALVPRLSANALMDWNGTSFSDRASGWLMGAQMGWTFSAGGAELAQRKAAAESIARARAELDDARAAVQVEVVSALRRVQSARAREAAGRAAVKQAAESQRIIRDRFDAGLATVNDVLRASTSLLDAEADRTSALVEATVSEAALRRALGRAP